MAAEGNGDLPVPDLRTMEELCQPSLNGRGGLIAPIAIQATNFGIKNDMIQQVQNSCQFHGLPGDDANKRLDKFLHVTQSIKVNGVTDDALRLNLFPPLDNPELTIQRRSRADPTLLNDFKMAAEENGDLPVPDLWTMEELCQPSLNGRGGPISPIAIQATKFRLKNDMIQQVQNSCQFHGLLGNGDLPVPDLRTMEELCQPSLNGRGGLIAPIAIQATNFGIKNDMIQQVDRLSSGTVDSWDILKKAFIQRYRPPSKTAKQLEDICNFKHEGDETLYQAWERYNDLLYKFPTHDINSHQKVNIFYNGLSIMNRQLLDSQGPISGITPIQALTAIQTMADHSQKWHDGSSSKAMDSSSNYEGIASIVNTLDNLGRDMKKLKENVHAIQVGCQTSYNEVVYMMTEQEDPWKIKNMDEANLERQDLTPVENLQFIGVGLSRKE
nr:hypothetical protein [Tanacetum cinerariifolium]